MGPDKAQQLKVLIISASVAVDLCSQWDETCLWPDDQISI